MLEFRSRRPALPGLVDSWHSRVPEMVWRELLGGSPLEMHISKRRWVSRYRSSADIAAWRTQSQAQLHISGPSGRMKQKPFVLADCLDPTVEKRHPLL